MSVGQLIGWITGFSRSTPKDKVSIDGFIERLHYRVTCPLLLGFSGFITMVDLCGEVINCSSEYYKAPYMMHQYCSYNIFTIPKCHKGVYGGNSGSNCIYSGVGIHEDGEKIYHSYYKWAPVVILFQAISFYAPHRLWKSFESGKVFELTTYLRDSMLDPEVLNEQKKRATWVAEFLHKTLYRQRLFYMVYVFCQLLSVLNILGNIYFTNWYLQGVFFRYGWDSINLLNDNPFETYNPMHEAFPFVTKCTFFDYGPSGTPQKYDALCQLPWNPVHEKFYIIFWCWLIILFLLSAITFVCRLAELFLPVLRRFQLRKSLPPTKTTFPYWNSPTYVLANKLSVGNYFLVYMMGCNMDPVLFQCMVNDLAKLLSPHIPVHRDKEEEETNLTTDAM